MKNSIRVLGIIALVSVIGFSMVACDNGNGNGNDTRPTTPEAMSSKTALQYFNDNGIKAGWNLGNTLDAATDVPGQKIGSGKPIKAEETAWWNPVATQQLFNGVKESGFNIVRIPCTWLGHIGTAPDYKIDEARLRRVAEVVGYAKTAGFKAIIINIHHDGNYTEPAKGTWGFVDFKTAISNPAKKTEIENQISKVWTQIAEYFKNYGDYLIFETLNEVHGGNWGNGASNNEQDILFDWNQAALSAIRATGGNNATRYVAVPGLGSTEPGIVTAAYARGKLLPNDGTNGTGKLIVSVHYYDPAQYTVAGVTDQAFQLIHTWGTSAEKDHLAHEAGSLKTTFIDKGIAVYFGEWGAPADVRSTMNQTIKNTHLDYIGSVAEAARKNGIVPIYWDDGGDFKILERSNGKAKTGLWADTLSTMMTKINNTTPLPPGGGGNGDETPAVFTSWTPGNDSASTITYATPSGKHNITGTINGAEGYANISATPDAATLTKMKTMTSFSFLVTGDGNQYDVMVATQDTVDAGYNHYRYTFTTTDMETKITVNVSELAQANWGGAGVAPFTQSNVIEFQFQRVGNGTFDLTISDIKLSQ
jgi:endoglucanase